MSDLHSNDAITLGGLLRAKQVSAREVITAHIDRVLAVDPMVNAIVTRSFDQALAKAAAADDALARGQVTGLLHGLPMAHKDLAETSRRQDHLRLEALRRLRAGARRPDREPDVGGGRDQPGQNEHARVRRRITHRESGVRRDPKPLRPGP